MTKRIHTLPQDIYGLFEQPHKVSDTRLDELKETLGNLVKEALESAGKPSDFTLRMSNIGGPDRKLWFESRDPDYGLHSGKAYFKFLYGHLLEAIVLFLAKEAGHKIENEQKEIELDGILGHMDCTIDGVDADVKSASPYSFNKFVNGHINDHDSFGYRYQLSGYHKKSGTENSEVAWVVIDKSTGEIAVVSYEDFELPDAEARIEHIRDVIQQDEPPRKRCFEEKEDKNGNRMMPKICTFCKYKTKCWDFRAFQYSTGPVFMTNVVKQPRVMEVTDRYLNEADTEEEDT